MVVQQQCFKICNAKRPPILQVYIPAINQEKTHNYSKKEPFPRRMNWLVMEPLLLFVLAQGLIAEGVKVVAAGANPVLIARGIEKTTKALVAELKLMSKEVEDSELADVATVSAGNNHEVGNMIAEALSKVGIKGVVTLEEGKSAENSLYVVEGMQSDKGYFFPLLCY